MSKQVSITTYRYDELSEQAKSKARASIVSRLYDTEYFWMDESLRDFKDNVLEDEQYRFDQLPKNICYQFDFYDYLGEYEGVMLGKDLIKALETFLNDTYEHLTFSESDIEDFSDEENCWFTDDGSLFSKGW